MFFSYIVVCYLPFVYAIILLSPNITYLSQYQHLLRTVSGYFLRKCSSSPFTNQIFQWHIYS